ncbi:glycosyltransferase family 2 protein [Methanobacterium oryzae]|uniref:glycosyltransferase family 2 protein n=1 Tax=Methanobacterium oryzae TaxID=69540 RepID=UPI003D20A43A
MNPKVSIITLNWNGWQDTIECLESLYKIDYPNYDVILVDNGSKDDSLDKIKEYCAGKINVKSEFFEYSMENKPIKIAEFHKEDLTSEFLFEKEIKDAPLNKRLFLIKNDINYGFAEGNNIAIEFAQLHLNPDYFLLLNNDTVVDKNFLKELIKTAESSEIIGAVGPKIYYYDFNGRKDVISFAGQKVNLYTSSGKRFALNEVDIGQRDSIEETDYVEGSCLLVKEEVIEKIGMLDAKFFAYWEETDFCIRIKNSGYNLMYVPSSKIWHKVSISRPNKIKAYYLTRNRFIFMKKHAKPIEYSTFLLVFTLKFTYLSLELLYYGNMNIYLSFLKGIKDGLAYKQAYEPLN